MLRFNDGHKYDVRIEMSVDSGVIVVRGTFCYEALTSAPLPMKKKTILKFCSQRIYRPGSDSSGVGQNENNINFARHKFSFLLGGP